MKKELTLILGGARAGKSVLGERLAGEASRVLYVATAEAKDEEMARRIEAHRARRPQAWQCLEEPLDIPEAIAAYEGTFDLLLLDCVTVWTSNVMLSAPEGVDVEAEALRRTERLLRRYEDGDAAWVVISNEVGLGVVPPSVLGRRYRDVLGKVNQRLAAAADRVLLVVAGLALDMKALGAQPIDRDI